MRIAYCTNVHAGPTLASVRDALAAQATAVRAALGVPRLELGLWLARPATAELLVEPEGIARLAEALAEQGLAVAAMNAFPQGDFHGPIVKHRVYRPAWDEPDRAAYTLEAARVLAGLIPEGASGSVSTVPLGWRGAVDEAAALVALAEVAEELARLEATSGRRIHLDLEPEPGCALDRAEDVVALWERGLGPGGAWRGAEPAIRRHLGVCHDVCHAEVMREAQADVVARYDRAGIAIGRVQISSAPCVDFDALEPADREEARAQLAAFAEDRYLHQTTRRDRRGRVHFHDDLPAALAAEPSEGEWRVHFHVPIFLDRAGPIGTTQSGIDACLAAVAGRDLLLEVETYAWNVLPPALRAATLAEGIARELRWLRERVA